jgi:hypothetical protein
MEEPGLGHAKNYVLALALTLPTLAAVSLYVSLQRARSQYDALARAEGRAVFHAVMAMRELTTARGGIYVSATDRPVWNEYPAEARRDGAVTGDAKLTRINHAQMVRMLSEVLTEKRGIGLHITSRQPLLARNAPDPWETQALTSFGKGQAEAQTVVKTAVGDGVFRYMAPLKTERSCLDCHHEPSEAGEIRGGITVSFSFAPFQQSINQSARLLWLVHIAGVALSLGLVAMLGARLLQNVGALDVSLRRIRQLEGLVPICAWCKKLRTEGADPALQSSWVPVEKYLGDRTNTTFSHDMCPECFERAGPEQRTAAALYHDLRMIINAKKPGIG